MPEPRWRTRGGRRRAGSRRPPPEQARRRAERDRHVENRARRAGAHVERARSRLVDGQRQHVGVSDVCDVDEVASLPAVLVHPRRLATFVGAAEHAGDPGVRRVARHPWPVDVVVTQRRDGAPVVLSGVRRAEPFLGQLRRGVHVARVEPVVLGDGFAPSWRPHTGTAARSDRRRDQRPDAAPDGPARAHHSGTGPRRRRPCSTPTRSGPAKRRSCNARSRHAVPTSLRPTYSPTSAKSTPSPTLAAW